MEESVAENTQNKDGVPFLRESFMAADLLPFGEHGVNESASLGESAPSLVTLVEGERAEEAKSKHKGIGFIEFIGGKAGIVNRNRRFYSQTVYELAVERAKPLIASGQFLGEVDHPYAGTLRGAAFRITRLYMDGDLMKAEAIVLDTAGGKHLKALLDGGVGVAISTRGYGSAKFETMKVNGEDKEVAVIQNDFRLEGIDAVLFPSNPSGAVTRHENSQHKENSMTLEQLRQEHPELVAQIESAAREGYVAEAEIESRVETARNEALNAAEVQAPRTAIAAVVEALRPLVPELQKEADAAEKSETEKALEALTAQVAELSETVNAERTRADEAVQAQQEAEAKTARNAVIDGLLEGFAHAELVRPELEALESDEAIRSTFEARKSMIEALLGRGSVDEAAGTEDDAGVGEADLSEDAEDETTAETISVIEAQKSYISDL